MKKLISFALVLLMALGCMGSTYAAEVSSDGLTVDGWNGWTVTSGTAVTTETNPLAGDSAQRGTVVKVTGGSAERYFARWFTGIIELSVDVYGEGTISFGDSNGRSAGSVDLADGTINSVACNYDAEAWNTVKLLVITGTKTTEVYLGDSLITTIALTALVRPTKLTVSSESTIYVDNIKVSELKKTNAYADNELNVVYESNFDTDGEKPLDGWSSSYATVVTEEGIGENVVKFEKAVTSSNQTTRMKYNIGKMAGFVFEAELLQPETSINAQTSGLTIQTRNYTEKDEATGNNGEGTAITLMTFGKDGYISIGTDEISSEIVNPNPVYTLGEWFKIKIEVLLESQSIDAYIATLNSSGEYGNWVKLNNEPVRLFNGTSSVKNAEIYEALEEILFNFNSTSSRQGLFYIKNIKISTPSSIKREPVFTSSSVADFFSKGYAGSATGSYYYRDETVDGENAIVMEKISTANVSTGDMKYNNTDISGDAVFSVDLYNPSTSNAGLELCYYVDGSNSSSYIARLRVGSIHDASYPQDKWFNLRVELDESEDKGYIYIDNKYAVTVDRAYATINSLRFYLNKSASRDGSWYLKNIELSKAVERHVVDGWEAYSTYEDNVTRGNVIDIKPGYIELKDSEGKVCDVPVAGGTVTAVNITKNIAVSETAKILVAVYEGDELSKSSLVDITDSKTHTLSTPLATTENSVVKAFIWDMKTLVPLADTSSVNETERTKLVLFGDSIVCDYEETHIRGGWGQLLGNYVNTNKLEILNYAVSGATSSDFLGTSNRDATAKRHESYKEAIGLLDTGDYVMISLTTNDSSYLKAGGDINENYETANSFAANIWKMITDIKEQGATPILVTTNPRCYYNGQFKRFTVESGAYQAMILDMERIAKEQNIDIINLYEMAVDSYDTGNVVVGSSEINPEEATDGSIRDTHFVSVDHTHLTPAGASHTASLVAKGMAQLDCGIEDFVK